MRKTLSSSDRQDAQPLVFLSAPKRKRGDSIDLAITASRQGDDSDDDFVFPLHKRSNSSTRLALCTSSYDTERRDGPASDDDGLDDETEALVKKFRSSIFRGPEAPVSPSCTSTSSCSKYDDEEDDDDDDCAGLNFFDLPGIQRATTICDDASDFSTDNSCYADPPEMGSSSHREEEIIEQDDARDHWPSSLESRIDDKEDPVLEARRENPEWLSSSLTPRASGGAAQPSSLWNISKSGKDDFWGAGLTGLFQQGSV